MADKGSNGAGADASPASRDEIDDLGAVIAATIAVAARTGSRAAAALLDRALQTLNERVRTTGAPAAGGGTSGPLNPSDRHHV